MPCIVSSFALFSHWFPYSLSFYKETLAGETDNYVHMRGSADQKPALAVLRELVEENLQSLHSVKQIASVQPGLVDICVGHVKVSTSPDSTLQSPA